MSDQESRAIRRLMEEAAQRKATPRHESIVTDGSHEEDAISRVSREEESNRLEDLRREESLMAHSNGKEEEEEEEDTGDVSMDSRIESDVAPGSEPASTTFMHDVHKSRVRRIKCKLHRIISYGSPPPISVLVQLVTDKDDVPPILRICGPIALCMVPGKIYNMDITTVVEHVEVPYDIGSDVYASVVPLRNGTADIRGSVAPATFEYASRLWMIRRASVLRRMSSVTRAKMHIDNVNQGAKEASTAHSGRIVQLAGDLSGGETKEVMYRACAEMARFDADSVDDDIQRDDCEGENRDRVFGEVVACEDIQADRFILEVPPGSTATLSTEEMEEWIQSKFKEIVAVSGEFTSSDIMVDDLNVHAWDFTSSEQRMLSALSKKTNAEKAELFAEKGLAYYENTDGTISVSPTTAQSLFYSSRVSENIKKSTVTISDNAPKYIALAVHPSTSGRKKMSIDSIIKAMEAEEDLVISMYRSHGLNTKDAKDAMLADRGTMRTWVSKTLMVTKDSLPLFRADGGGSAFTVSAATLVYPIESLYLANLLGDLQLSEIVNRRLISRGHIAWKDLDPFCIYSKDAQKTLSPEVPVDDAYYQGVDDDDGEPSASSAAAAAAAAAAAKVYFGSLVEEVVLGASDFSKNGPGCGPLSINEPDVKNGTRRSHSNFDTSWLTSQHNAAISEKVRAATDAARSHFKDERELKKMIAIACVFSISGDNLHEHFEHRMMSSTFKCRNPSSSVKPSEADRIEWRDMFRIAKMTGLIHARIIKMGGGTSPFTIPEPEARVSYPPLSVHLMTLAFGHITETSGGVVSVYSKSVYFSYMANINLINDISKSATVRIWKTVNDGGIVGHQPYARRLRHIALTGDVDAIPPRAGHSMASSAAAAAAAGAAAGEHSKVLVITPSSARKTLLDRILLGPTQCSFTVERWESNQSALSGKYDIVVVDQMHLMAGPVGKKHPLILLSGGCNMVMGERSPKFIYSGNPEAKTSEGRTNVHRLLWLAATSGKIGVAKHSVISGYFSPKICFEIPFANAGKFSASSNMIHSLAAAAKTSLSDTTRAPWINEPSKCAVLYRGWEPSTAEKGVMMSYRVSESLRVSSADRAGYLPKPPADADYMNVTSHKSKTALDDFYDAASKYHTFIIVNPDTWPLELFRAVIGLVMSVSARARVHFSIRRGFSASATPWRSLFSPPLSFVS